MRRLFMAVLVLNLLPGAVFEARADEVEQFTAQMIHELSREREVLKRELVYSWLRGDPEEVWRNTLSRFVDVCLNRAVLSSKEDPILSGFITHDDKPAPAAVLLLHLGQQGIDLRSAHAFQGKRFVIYRDITDDEFDTDSEDQLAASSSDGGQ